MRSRLVEIVREPLVHFLVIGAALFLYWHFFGDRLASPSQKILITPAHVERIAQVWAKTHLRPPTAPALSAALLIALGVAVAADRRLSLALVAGAALTCGLVQGC